MLADKDNSNNEQGRLYQACKFHYPCTNGSCMLGCGHNGQIVNVHFFINFLFYSIAQSYNSYKPIVEEIVYFGFIIL